MLLLKLTNFNISNIHLSLKLNAKLQLNIKITG